MHVVCLDLEGVLIPEIWINVAEKTGIKELMKTTRDEPNYEKLMKYRLEILENSEITIDDIQENLQQRIKLVSKLINNEKNGFIKKKLEQRLSMLSGSVGIIKVGANSKVELK